MRDGWHVVCGYEVFVEDGKILRGIIGKDNNRRTAYPYRYDKKYQDWMNVSGLSVSAFRSGVRRGSTVIA